MKRFLLILVCLLGLGLSFASSVSNPSSTDFAVFAPPSDDGWENIGSVSTHRQSHQHYAFDSGTADLYAKAIGNKVFYQLRYKLEKDNSSQIFTVATGNWEFFCSTHNSWHTFDGKAGDYYINLP